MTKPTKWHVRPAKTQIRLGGLGIRPVWSESSLSTWRKHVPLATHWAHNEDFDQAGRMSRMTWVFAGRTVILSVLSWGGSNVKHWHKDGNTLLDEVCYNAQGRKYQNIFVSRSLDAFIISRRKIFILFLRWEVILLLNCIEFGCFISTWFLSSKFLDSLYN